MTNVTEPEQHVRAPQLRSRQYQQDGHAAEGRLGCSSPARALSVLAKECADSKADRLATVYALDMDPVVARLAIKEDDEATEPRGLRKSTAST